MRWRLLVFAARYMYANAGAPKLSTMAAVLVRNSPAHFAHSRMRHVNTLSLLVALTYAVLLMITGCFDSRDFPAVHTKFAYSLFVFGNLFGLLQTWLDWRIVHPQLVRLRLRDGGAHGWLSRRHSKLALTLATAAVSVLTLILKLANAPYGTVALFEYLIVACLLLFWLSLGLDFALFRVSVIARAGGDAAPGSGVSSAGRVVVVDDI